MSAATVAASSSVPPGFSEGAAINARANATTSSGSTDRAAASAAGDRTADASEEVTAGNATSRASYDGRMTFTDLRAVLSTGLDADPRPEADPGERLAAVLALLIEDPEPGLLFTERAATLSRHPGEVSFPGGLMEPQDDRLLTTALRETHEEIGIDPALPAVLGALPPIHTFVSGVLVTPFVAVIRTLPELHESRAEIARVLTVPTARLAALEQRRELHRDGGRVWQGWWYETDDATIWGATGFMLHAFLQHARARAPWLTTA
jgi:8-oxo-dGTP pyrophosphatase MutT (NUDIX family)